MSVFKGVSLDGFLLWVKREYDKNPDEKVSVKFILECLRPELLDKKNGTN